MPQPEPRDRVSKPILLTVDDDPTVSRAVARDLRRQYGEAYRIMRADFLDEALTLIREVVLRGEQVAVILADDRMPGMNGLKAVRVEREAAGGQAGPSSRIENYLGFPDGWPAAS